MALPSIDGARRSSTRTRPSTRTRLLAQSSAVASAVAACAMFSVFAALASMAACAPAAAPVAVERAVLALAGGGAPATVYFTARNMSDAPVALVGLEIDAAEHMTMQSTTPHRMPPGSAAMGPTTLLLPVDTVVVPARGSVRFAPGGFTGVVGTLRRSLERGDSVRLTVRTARGRAVTATARVLAYADLDTALSPAGVAIASSGEPSLAEGLTIYRSDGCASCHGVGGHGDGPVGLTLSPRPRDFRDATAFKNGPDVAAIAQTLATGIPNGGAMPLYAHLTDRERRSLALYVISLRTPTPSPEPQP